MKPKAAGTPLGLAFYVLALAASLHADGPPAVPAMARLFDNGRAFTTLQRRLPIRCLDLPGLLSLPTADQAQKLDRAAAAGFNSVSFEAPLFGPDSLAPKLGAVDDGKRQALGRLLDAFALRRLYAFPVLFPASAVDALGGTDPAHVTFFAGRNAVGWEAWALEALAKTPVKDGSVTACASVAGWILYRGPWPDGCPLPGRPAALTPSVEARLTAWAAWQVKVARRLGFRQELGLGLWAKRDLGVDAPADAADVASPAGSPAPVAPLSIVTFDPTALNQEGAALDALPPVPGDDAQKVDDSASIPAAPASPWDLEGLDWGQVDDLFQRLPTLSQLNFLEFTLNSEDWYRVGDRLAEAAGKADVPILWRQDWRKDSSYERQKHLAPPAPLAGLVGPWPDDDWPDAGNALWAPQDPPRASNAPFFVRAWTWEKGPTPVLLVQMSRPCDMTLRWAKKAPLNRSVTGAKAGKGPRVEQHFELEGLKPGDWFLMRLEAHSPTFGSAVVRTRWMQVPR